MPGQLPARVWLAQGIAAYILEQARQAHPGECCGLLEGTRRGEAFHVVAAHAARNLAGRGDRFLLDPRDHIAAQKSARSRGRRLVGCYHSHPNGRAEPSAIDLAGADEDDFLWLIAGEGAVKAFVYLRGVFTGAEWVTSSG